MIPTPLLPPLFHCPMHYRLPTLLLVLSWIAFAPAANAGDSMRCGSRLLQVEARAAELLAVCGEPAYRDVWAEPDASGLAWVSGMEEWTYNFGPQQLLRVVRLRNARVVDIGEDGYGFSAPADNGRGCPPDRLVEGMSKYRLLTSCGEPLTRTAFRGFRAPRAGGWYGRYNQGYAPVYREEWVYNFGSRYLMRVVTIENGRVSLVENGERGADPR